MQSRDVVRLLPEVFQRALTQGGPMNALVNLMANLITEVEGNLDRFPDELRVDRANPEFVYFLARFVDLDRFFLQTHAGPAVEGAATASFPAGVEQLRILIAAAPELSRLRGTREGMCRLLEKATGISGYVVEEAPLDQVGQPRPFHIRITAPAAARSHERLITRVIEADKPAYVTYELVFSPGSILLPVESRSRDELRVIR